VPISSFTPGDTFRTKLLGFDKDEVRSCLENLTRDYEEARNQVEQLTIKLKALENSRNHAPAPSRAPSHDSVGIQVEKVLASAHRVAEDVKLEAAKAAKQILGEAQEEALRLRSLAENDATALTKTAATRLGELNGEVERMIERREVAQTLLHRAADQLEALAHDVRSSIQGEGLQAESRSKPRAESQTRQPEKPTFSVT
jgi:cell division septum initiation protein DivIVA